MVLRFVICLTLFSLLGLAQEKPSDFVLDHGKPWAYLRLDHVGPRKPFFRGEGEVGIWLRVVNNCRLPFKLFTMGAGSDGQGELLLDEVVPVEEGFTISSSIPSEPPQQADRPRPPAGYWGREPDLVHVATVNPGEDILFSVPRDHVGKQWYMRVEFFLDVGSSPVPTGPPCYLELSEGDLPKNRPAKRPVAPHGASLHAGWRRAKLCDWSLEGTQTSLSMLKRDESLR
jgi:hypothetical protein